MLLPPKANTQSMFERKRRRFYSNMHGSWKIETIKNLLMRSIPNFAFELFFP